VSACYGCGKLGSQAELEADPWEHIPYWPDSYRWCHDCASARNTRPQSIISCYRCGEAKPGPGVFVHRATIGGYRICQGCEEQRLEALGLGNGKHLEDYVLDDDDMVEVSRETLSIIMRVFVGAELADTDSDSVVAALKEEERH
jgi:hypothetical protein